MTHQTINLEQFKRLRKELNDSSPDALIVIQLIRLIDHMADRIIDLEIKVRSTEKQIEALDTDVEYLMKEEEDEN